MTHVVCEPCVDCKNTVCVTVCPVECFHEEDRILYIDPDVCIDCGACLPECPEDAIFLEEDVPEQWKHFIALNVEKSKVLPVLSIQKPPLGTRKKPAS